MIHERLTSLTSAEVRQNMQRVEPQESRSDSIAQELAEIVFDQPNAMKAIGRRIAMFESGLQEPTRPIGSMFFLGPTGVGKTESAHALAKHMFGDAHSDRLKIINMAEYSESHDTKKFVGSPPSYVGSGEQSAIPHDWLHKGRSIVVLDEFEKANPEIQRLMLGVLDKGTMNSRNGEKGFQDLHFENALIIMTSNIGAREISGITEGRQQNIGFINQGGQDKSKAIDEVARRQMKKLFAPEFLERLDDVIVFKPLEGTTFGRIFDKVIERRNALLKGQNTSAPHLAVTEEFKTYVLGGMKDQGGRAVRRLLDKHLFDQFADVTQGIDTRNRPFVADIEDESTVFYTDEPVELFPLEEPLVVQGGEITFPLPDGEKKETEEPDANGSTGGNSNASGGKDKEIVPPDPNAPMPPSDWIKDAEGGNIPPSKPVQIGLEIRVWDENAADENGDVIFREITLRNIVLPPKQ